MSLLVGRWFEVASWLCLHTVWPHVQFSQLSGLAGPCGHDFSCSFLIFLASVPKCKTEWEGKQVLCRVSLQSKIIFGMIWFTPQIEWLISPAFSFYNYTICLIKVPLHNAAAFMTSNCNVSNSAGVLCLSVLLLPKWRGEFAKDYQYLWI